MLPRAPQVQRMMLSLGDVNIPHVDGRAYWHPQALRAAELCAPTLLHLRLVGVLAGHLFGWYVRDWDIKVDDTIVCELMYASSERDG